MDPTIHLGDCLDVLPTLGTVNAVVTDPPYGLKFMKKGWDCFPKTGNGFRRMANAADIGRDNQFGCMSRTAPELVAGTDFQRWCQQWAGAVIRVLKPGGYMLCFGGTRTYHRLACAIEDAGFEIRDCIMWLYGSGFPKGQGCLKPAYEPILVARRPGPTVLPLGIDECRVEPTGESQSRENEPSQHRRYTDRGGTNFTATPGVRGGNPAGRWPANVVHDGSDEVIEEFAAFGDRGAASKVTVRNADKFRNTFGTAARFFYCAKASKRDRGEGNTHPTVKPLALMEWLVKLVCPPGGTVLDPFAGSGTTLVAAMSTGRRAIGIERDQGYFDIASKRTSAASTPAAAEELTLFRETEDTPCSSPK